MLNRLVLLPVSVTLSGQDPALIGLWLAVAVSGIYHGVNPGMGWPLAVSAGLMERKVGALFASLLPLAFGHFLAMAAMVLPFALLASLVFWQREIRIGASLLVIAFGVFRFINRRHPRLLARIRPAQLALWSFAIAIAHGAGLMLVPIYLGMSKASGHESAGALIGTSLTMALLVSIVHTVAMIAAGGIAAWLVYRYLGLEYLSKSWFNLDALWASSLILVGGIGLLAAL